MLKRANMQFAPPALSPPASTPSTGGRQPAISNAQGCAVLRDCCRPTSARRLPRSIPTTRIFRSKIVMGRHGFGRGEYKYFCYPLPDLIAELRPALYAQLHGVAIAGTKPWASISRYPNRHAAFLKRCHGAGQTRPTPLLLQYGAGDYNCLHQDLMANMFSHCRSQSCCRSRARTSPAANSC